jgi:hypothetical protein
MTLNGIAGPKTAMKSRFRAPQTHPKSSNIKVKGRIVITRLIDKNIHIGIFKGQELKKLQTLPG